MQLVFLFDLDAFQGDFTPKTVEQVNKHILRIRLLCLRVLTDFGSRIENMRWGFKFFKSSGSFNQSMDIYSFFDSSLENFEILENEINLRYERFYLNHDADKNPEQVLHGLKPDNDSSTPSVKLLHLALTQLLYEYQWDTKDICTPVKKSDLRISSSKVEARNFLFLISQCPSTKESLMKYFKDVNIQLSVDVISDLLLPQSLSEKFLNQANVHWVWLDTSQVSKSLLNSATQSDVSALMSSALQTLSGSLVPFDVWSQPCMISKIIPLSINIDTTAVQSQPSTSCNTNVAITYGALHNSFLPFSTIIQKSLNGDMNEEQCFHESSIVFPDDLQVDILLCNLAMPDKLSEPNSSRKGADNMFLNFNNVQSSVSQLCEKCNCIKLSTFLVKYLVERTTIPIEKISSCRENYACCPKSLNDVPSKNVQFFKELMKLLSIQNKSMVMECTVESHIKFTGLLNPCSDSLASITILNEGLVRLQKGKLPIRNINPKENLEEIEIFLENVKQQFSAVLPNQNVLSNDPGESSPGTNYKPFQMEAMEKWFDSSSAISDMASEINANLKNQEKNQPNWLKKLRAQYKTKASHQHKAALFNTKTGKDIQASHKHGKSAFGRSKSLNESHISLKTRNNSFPPSQSSTHYRFQAQIENDHMTEVYSGDTELSFRESSKSFEGSQTCPDVEDTDSDRIFKMFCSLNRRNMNLSQKTNPSHSQEISALVNRKSVEELHGELQGTTLNKVEPNENDTSFKTQKVDLNDVQSNIPETFEMPVEEAPENKTKQNIDSEEALLKETKDIYNSAIDSSELLIPPIKSIINMVLNFYQTENSSSYLDKVKSFLQNNICLTVKRISEKYENCVPAESLEKKVKEYQLQAILAFEKEILFSPVSESICVDSVTALLRMTSFLSSPAELKSFLHNVLKENYFEKLQNILVEIGDELNIPIIPDENSDDSGSELAASFESLSDINLSNSVQSSTGMSCSSTSSIKSNRISFQKRSDLERNIQRREIMIPGVMLKKRPKLLQSSEDFSKRVKYSPHLDVKKFKKKSANQETKTVRRNLFSIEKENQSSKTSPATHNPFRRKRKPIASKSLILKTKYVAGTPSPKQRRFNENRHFSTESPLVKEVAESPKSSQSIKDAYNLRMLRHLQRSHSVSTEKTLSPDVSNRSLEARNIVQYTPDSKRRLSLKLFSKLLTSPTANRGPKRCSKRLFDQMTPTSSHSSSSSKRMKHSANSQSVQNSSKTIVETDKQAPHPKKQVLNDHGRSPLICNEITLKSNRNKSPLFMMTQTPSTSRDSISNRKFTPPTNFSLLHLTTSPLLNVKPSKKSPNL